MKCYLQNHCGTVFRADKIKWLKELLPKPTDISRRIILCQQNKIQFQPYELRLVETDFEKLKTHLGDTNHGAVVYHLFTNDNMIICNIFEYGTNTGNSTQAEGGK